MQKGSKGNYLKRKEKLAAEAKRREQDIKNRLLSELGGINGISMNQLSANSKENKATDGQVAALAGPMRAAGPMKLKL